MYTVSARRTFPATHFLTVPEAGPKGDPHTHRYAIDVRLSGDELDDRGYLVDIDELTGELDRIESRYRDATLNDLPAFEGQNPSVERFARIVADALASRIDTTRLSSIAVRVHEDDVAWAAYAYEC